MSNPIFAFPDKTLAATVTPVASTWIESGGLSLSNLTTLPLAEVAVSTSWYAGFKVDFGGIITANVIALIGHNISRTATISVEYTDENYTTVTVVDNVSAHDNWLPYGWEDNTGFATDMLLNEAADELPDIAFVFPDGVKMSNVTIKINNGSTPIRLARCFVGAGFQTTGGISPGMSFGFVDDTTVQRSLDGTAYFDVRKKRKTLSFAMESIQDEEGLVYHWQAARYLGKDGEMYFIPFPEAGYGLQKQQSMLCTMSELSPLENSSFGRVNQSYKLEQKV